MPIYFALSPFDLPLTLESIGNHWSQEPIRRPKGYPLYHWLQTEQGRGVVEINGKQFLLKANEGILIAPDIPHFYRPDGDHLWLTSFATFTGTLRTEIPKIAGETPFTLVSAADGRPCRQFVNRLVAAHESRSLDPVALSGECYSFLLRFSCDRRSHDLADHPRYRKYILPVIQKIETDYNRALTVPELAALVYITPQYLTRLFHRFLGCSVYTYLLNFRISMAKELLLNEPETEIQHIAHRVGFQDASHFISVFGASTGYTPLGFRRLHGVPVS